MWSKDRVSVYIFKNYDKRHIARNRLQNIPVSDTVTPSTTLSRSLLLALFCVFSWAIAAALVHSVVSKPRPFMVILTLSINQKSHDARWSENGRRSYHWTFSQVVFPLAGTCQLRSLYFLSHFIKIHLRGSITALQSERMWRGVCSKQGKGFWGRFIKMCLLCRHSLYMLVRFLAKFNNGTYSSRKTLNIIFIWITLKLYSVLERTCVLVAWSDPPHISRPICPNLLPPRRISWLYYFSFWLQAHHIMFIPKFLFLIAIKNEIHGFSF